MLGFRDGVMAIDERTADLLSALAPPFRLSGGPDFILSQRAPGNFAGATPWLQNPTDVPMPVSFSLTIERGVAGKSRTCSGRHSPAFTRPRWSGRS